MKDPKTLKHGNAQWFLEDCGAFFLKIKLFKVCSALITWDIGQFLNTVFV